MTFAQHLDRLLCPTPPPTGWSLPDADQHAWFLDSRAVPTPQDSPAAAPPVLHLVPSAGDGDGPPPQPQGVPNQPKLVVWNDEQRVALDTLSLLGAKVHVHASFDAVRRQWRQLARSLHPDSASNGGNPEAFAQAAAAWDVLKTGPLVVEATSTFAAGLR